MYFKVSIRTNPASGKSEGYYRLVESYRNSDGRVCHRTMLNVGFIDHLEAEELNRIQKLLNYKCQSNSNELFAFEYKNETPDIQRYVDDFYHRLVKEKKIDVPDDSVKENSCERDWQTIDMNSLRHKDVREMGSEWLCYQALSQLGVGQFLSSKQDWAGDDVRLALTHIISRAVYPASELKTARWIRENSAVCELTGYPVEQITKDRLYRISHRLYAVKDELESYLSHHTNELFDINDKIILYDLTNTYFEGQKQGSELARFGRSKEKRNDAKLVVLALVINTFGFIKYSAVFQGNMSDPATLETIIKGLRNKTSGMAEKALVVIDAGIATKENLAKIRAAGYDYLCVCRARLKDYKTVEGTECLTVEDNRKRKIKLQKVTTIDQSTDDDKYYLKVESEGKRKKEFSMNNRFKDGYLKGLESIAGSLTKKGGVKQEDKVHERVGRLKQKYPSIHKYYDIDYQVEEQAVKKKVTKKSATAKQGTTIRIVTAMSWKLKENIDMNVGCGVYFLSTSLNSCEQILWDSYNVIREIENTIRILKTDLDLRPVFHQNDDSTMAHLHLALLAYWVVNTVRFQLKKGGINLQWNEIIRIMNTQKAVTTTAQNNCEQIIQIRRCSEPNEKVKTIYQLLKYKSTPFKKKKSVVHKLEFKKNENGKIQGFKTG